MSIDQGLDIALGLCRGVVQEYLAYLQGVPVGALFADVQQSTGEIGFRNGAGLCYFMRVALVDDPEFKYRFPVERCPGREVAETHDRILRNVQFVTRYLLEREVNGAAVTRPELFTNARIVFTPHKTAFLYNEAHGRELHDRFTKRIAVVWSREAVSAEALVEPATAASAVRQRVDMSAVSHEDDWTGPRNATTMSESDASDMIAIINRGRCRVCGVATANCACSF